MSGEDEDVDFFGLAPAMMGQKVREESSPLVRATWKLAFISGQAHLTAYQNRSLRSVFHTQRAGRNRPFQRESGINTSRIGIFYCWYVYEVMNMNQDNGMLFYMFVLSFWATLSSRKD